MRRLSRCALCIAIAIEIYLAISIARDVANVTTTRLYLAARTDAAPTSDASERFDIEGSRVVPQIAVRQRERIAFDAANPWPSTLRVSVRPAGLSPYEIRWRNRDTAFVLARGTSADTATIAASIPPGPGMVELIAHGPLTWVDPRMVSHLRVTRRALLFLVCGALALLVARQRSARPGVAAPVRRAAFKATAMVGGIVLGAASLECGLRALGDHAPAPILAERHDLGEVRKDPRWQHTQRYGRRLRANVRETSEWRYGDTVRMGFVPAPVADGVPRRFPFRTDAEGFRNARARERIDVAALGDSFTDAMTLEESLAWPLLLEQQSGLVVQNYGTAGFGPQQELRVLTDYALAHRPRVVILAYFAGNDLFEAESFDEFERSSGAIRRPDPGWPIKSVVSRADTWFVASALLAARRSIANHGRAEAKTMISAEAPVRNDGVMTPAFDRGMFSVPVNGRTLRWAFMPPYLNTLRMSEDHLSGRKGWALTKAALGAMRDASRAANAELVVMFLPFKSQIYLPVARASVPQDALSSALRYYLPDGRIDLDEMERNRLAQNRMMRRFCDEAGIRFVDTTDTLAERLRTGVNVYFPDDSHLNEAGQGVVAAALRNFLAREGIPTPGSGRHDN